MQTTNDIRRAFLDYFLKQGHELVPSSPLIPHHDPSLLFVNAGMVPFKNVFTGQETRPYVRATSCQKCIRAGGKHNDLENVGYTVRHHTFFEMLGNFSFGDYFKEEAILLAWNFITKEMGISSDRLCVTVYGEDEEAFSLWKRIADLEDQRIIRIYTHDNFWSMGETGPCGPCSEIFYDHGESIPGGPPGSVTQDGDRFVEIWNLVFMQYEQRSPTERLLLPKPSIDTGMGLERVAAVFQGVHDNYDTDVFKALINASVELTHRPATDLASFSHRIIADHLRSAGFLIADGILPSNEGRGYVLRRILRRALRHVHLLGCSDVLMPRLVPVLVDQMGAAYPELRRAEALIVQTMDLEEKRFRQTLDRGLRLLQEEVAHLPSNAPLSGEVAFKLYDTYGFPLDLTEDMLKEQGRSVELKGFEEAMARQKAEARASWVGSGEATTDQVYFDLYQQHGSTEFLGYSCEETHGYVQALVVAGKNVSQVKAGDVVTILTNQTPFYGESGGQMGDSGWITSAQGAEIEITQTQKKKGLHLHFGSVKKGLLTLGEEVTLLVDGKKRAQIKANHSATHLLHTALRRCLGNHVTQKGSLVSPDRLRFDFSHPQSLTIEELRHIEQDVNQQIRQNQAVSTQLMSPKEAIQAGALALFGEKYGEEVRVVSMGHLEQQHFSVELCGGTHVSRTGDIGFFKIVSEAGVAAGIRRIEALTGVAIENYIAAQEEILQQCTDLLKTPPEKMLDRLSHLIEERKRLERDLSHLRQKTAMMGEGMSSGVLLNEKKGDVSFLIQQTEALPAKELKGVVDQLKQQIGSGIVVLINFEEDKSALLIGVTSDLISRFSAVTLIQQATTFLGGKGGGGRPDLAQASGPLREKIPAFVAFLKSV